MLLIKLQFGCFFFKIFTIFAPDCGFGHFGMIILTKNRIYYD